MSALAGLYKGVEVHRDDNFYWAGGWSYPRQSRITDGMALPGLEDFKERKGLVEAARISKESAEMGNEIHRLIQSFSSGFRMSKPDFYLMDVPIQNGLICWQQAEQYFEQFGSKAVGSEVVLVSHEYKYACAADRIQLVDGSLEIWDWKTKQKILTPAYCKHFPQILLKMKLQLAANWNAYEETFGDKISQARDILIYQQRGYWTPKDQIIMTPKQQKFYFKIFKGLIDLYEGLEVEKGHKKLSEE